MTFSGSTGLSVPLTGSETSAGSVILAGSVTRAVVLSFSPEGRVVLF